MGSESEKPSTVFYRKSLDISDVTSSVGQQSKSELKSPPLIYLRFPYVRYGQRPKDSCAVICLLPHGNQEYVVSTFVFGRYEIRAPNQPDIDACVPSGTTLSDIFQARNVSSLILNYDSSIPDEDQRGISFFDDPSYFTDDGTVYGKVERQVVAEPLRSYGNTEGRFVLSPGRERSADQFLHDCEAIDKRLRGSLLPLGQTAAVPRRPKSSGDDDGEWKYSLEGKRFPERSELDEYGLFRLFESCYAFVRGESNSMFSIVSAASGELLDLIDDMLGSNLEEYRSVVKLACLQQAQTELMELQYQMAYAVHRCVTDPTETSRTCSGEQLLNGIPTSAKRTLCMYAEMSIPTNPAEHLRRTYKSVANIASSLSRPQTAGLHTLCDMFTAKVRGSCGKDKLGTFLRKVQNLRRQMETLLLQVGGKGGGHVAKDSSILIELTPTNTPDCPTEGQIQRGVEFAARTVMELCMTALELATTLSDVPDVTEVSWDKWELRGWYESTSTVAEIARILQEVEQLTVDKPSRRMSDVVQTLHTPFPVLVDAYPVENVVSTLCQAEAAVTTTAAAGTLGDRWDIAALALVHELSSLMKTNKSAAIAT
eukprot:gb/GECG01015006.1/.p1 GENE.gb/GECG01015006.1/~~gb/GECG01015006.1/.p1  ORF type:complete len:596 (+),score=61.96 gb/GECG01015006.1/:1-1788(+)